jgi:copper chaperone CopZ
MQGGFMSRPFATMGAVVVVSLLWPSYSSAQIEEVKIGIEGLTCNLCAITLERSLRRVDGVEDVRVEVGDEAVTVRLKAGVPFNLEQLNTAVKNAGQQARDFELRLRAAVRQQDGRYSLEPAGVRQPFVVHQASAGRLATLVGKTVLARTKVSSSKRSPLEFELMDVAVQD